MTMKNSEVMADVVDGVDDDPHDIPVFPFYFIFSAPEVNP